MSTASRPARPAGHRHARRARLWLGLAGILFAGVVAALLLSRREATPYTPGMEAATSDEITRRLARDIPDEAPRIVFTDVAAEAGITFRHFEAERSTQLPEDMGSGAAWGDYDDDGDPDLYLVNATRLGEDGLPDSSSGPRSALYRNDGDGRFTDVTPEAGLATAGEGMGAAWGDYDDDGDLDLVVSRYGTNVLYRNDEGVFTDVSAAAGLSGDTGFWTGVSWADFDRDGDLDLYVCGYVRYRLTPEDRDKTSFQYGSVLPYTLNPSSYTPERNFLYRNDGGVFTDVAQQAGVDNPEGRSLSASWADFDADGWPDLYVANDISDNALYRNRGDGTFVDVSHSAWVADYRGAMGLGIGDWDNDGDTDIFVTHWLAQENALYENLAEKMPATETEPLHFIDQADMLGLGQIALDFVGWGTAFFDYDNDGRLDLFVANGSTVPVHDDPVRLVPMRNLLFWNAGAGKGYFEVGPVGGPAFTIENVGRGAAFADYDGDGDTDVVVNVNGGPARLLRNEAPAGNAWLRVVLRGPSHRAKGPATTSHAVGALVRVLTGSRTRLREVGAGSSYLSQEPPGEVRFGLGDAAGVDRLTVLWPDGRTQSFERLPVNATVRLVEGGEPEVIPAPARSAR